MNTLSGFFFPPKCVFCGRALAIGGPIDICGGCAGELPYFPGGRLFENSAAGNAACDRIVCALRYAGPVRAALAGFKFRNRREYGLTLAALLCERLAREESGREYDYAACVPLTRRRARERGYNQSAVLAGHVARHLGLRCEGGLLIRDEQALRQSALRRHERRANASRAFRVNESRAHAINAARPAASHSINSLPLCGDRILLVDDVATSMATINACAAALKAAGAADVTGAVLASR